MSSVRAGCVLLSYRICIGSYETCNNSLHTILLSAVYGDSLSSLHDVQTYPHTPQILHQHKLICACNSVRLDSHRYYLLTKYAWQDAHILGTIIDHSSLSIETAPKCPNLTTCIYDPLLKIICTVFRIPTRSI